MDAMDTDMILAPTADAGEDYVAQTLFIGDSNTVAMVSCGLLPAKNVYAANGIGVDDLGGAARALHRGGWRRALVTIGTNDLNVLAVGEYIESYARLLRDMKEAAPGASIVVNAVPPVRDGLYSPGGAERLVALYNRELLQLCRQSGTSFLNSAEVQMGPDGCSRPDMTAEDGIHLTRKGLSAVISYYRTHACNV